MPTTAEQLIGQALAYSRKNTLDSLATMSELIGVLGRSLTSLFAFAARINPTFYGTRLVVEDAGGGTWPRPANAESVVYIQCGGQRVAVVPLDDPTAEASLPSVVSFGQVYQRAAGLAAPVNGASLVIYYSRAAVRPTAPGETIDTAFPVSAHRLLVLDVARYLVTKDSGSGRESEAAALDAERAAELELYRQHLEHETANQVSRFGGSHAFSTPTLNPAAS